MANPPRPWFRLASIRAVPVPVPPPAPAPQAQPTQPPPPPQPQEAPSRFALDARTSAPPSPSQKVPPPAPSSSVQASPLQKAAITNSSSIQPSPVSHKDSSTSSSPRSPKTIKQAVQSPKQSPKLKTSVPPPSPLTLPPLSLKTEPNLPAEAEPKTVLVATTFDKPRQWPNGSGDYHRERETGESRNDNNHASSRHGKFLTGKGSETKEKGAHKKFSDSEDSGMRVITIAGENRGAYMELIQSQKKQEPKYLHKINGISKEKSDGGESEGSSSGEVNKNKKDSNNRGRGASSSSFPMAAYMNSNVQCVNNSLLFNASCSHHDPGVRLSLSKKPFGEGYHLKERVEGQNV